MVKYSVEAINEIILTVCQVPGRLTFITLWKFYQDLQKCQCKMDHPDHTDEGYAGYMMTQTAYLLYSTTLWTNTNDVGNYFIVPTTAITNTDQKSEERKWQSGNNLLDTFHNM